MSKDNGGPAFPGGDSSKIPNIAGNDLGKPYYTGMTLRDYFAAKAMQFFLPECVSNGARQHDDWKLGIALDCYAMADAMLKARGQ